MVSLQEPSGKCSATRAELVTRSTNNSKLPLPLQAEIYFL